jgi:hypothetical protein
MRIPEFPIFRYGIAVIFVGTALILSLLVHRSLPDGTTMKWFRRAMPDPFRRAQKFVRKMPEPKRNEN